VGRSWTNEQAISLAPDASALKTAQGLASPRKWTSLGRDDDFVWGLAQGSGAQPYQVQIDLSEPVFKCSCPSRKFPCKHGLGLLLMFANQCEAILPATKPEWVLEWAAKRAQKVIKQENKAAEAAAAPADPAAQTKRREKRQANIAQGLEFLDGWLRDLARQGFAGAAPAGYSFWDAPARRMIDAQAPGLARRIRALGNAMGAEPDSETKAVCELGRLHLLVTGSRRRSELSPDWQQELDAQLGWNVDQEELRRRDGIAGTWFAGAQTVREEEKILTRSTYLFSGDGRTARLLEFTPVAQPSVASIALGRWFEGSLVYFPGVQNLRAIWKSPPQDATSGKLVPLLRCEELLTVYGAAIAANPFADELPVVVELTPQFHHDRWWIRDELGAALPIVASFGLGWELLACSGGCAMQMVGSWDGFDFTPLAAISDGQLLPFTSRLG
jgi:hypothetical protein